MHLQYLKQQLHFCRCVQHLKRVVIYHKDCSYYITGAFTERMMQLQTVQYDTIRIYHRCNINQLYIITNFSVITYEAY